MHFIKQRLALCAMATLMLVTPLSTFAQSTTAISDLQALIVSLQARIAALQQQQQTNVTSGALPIIIMRPLTLGSRGADVSRVQTFLKAKRYYMYPEITGYYGIVTTRAVAAYQKAQGLESVGSVGPKTRALINAELAADTTNTIKGVTPSSSSQAKDAMSAIIGSGGGNTTSTAAMAPASGGGGSSPATVSGGGGGSSVAAASGGGSSSSSGGGAGGSTNQSAANTTTPASTESTEGTIVTTVGPAITDSYNNKWTLTNTGTPFQIAVNGVVDSPTGGVTQLVYRNHQVWQENKALLWWYKGQPSDPWTSMASVGPVTYANAMGDGFTLQWAEDFTKETTLNTSRWYRTRGGLPSFDSTYGMKLTSGMSESTGVYSQVYDTRFPGNRDPATAYIGATRFGRYIGRIYNNPTTSQNQAMWLVKPVFSNDDWNEIDLETYNAAWHKAGTIAPTFNLHWGDWVPSSTNPNRSYPSVGWHDWMIDWTPNYIAWYMDGTLNYVVYNNSTKPGWTEINGSGVEAQTFPQVFMFTNSDTGGGTGGGNPSMAIASSSYAALQMQSFAAASYNGHSGGVISTDSKLLLGAAGQQYVGSLNVGDYLRYNSVQAQWRNISVQVDASMSGRQIQVRTGSPTGPIIGTINVPVTEGPEWLYTDLKIQSDPTKVSSVSHTFNAGNASIHVGKTLVITGGIGFTPGTYTVTAVDSSGVATLDRAVGAVGATSGQGALQYQNPIRYTLASANLDARTGSTQNIFLTFVGGNGGFSIYNIYFFGTQPTSQLGNVIADTAAVAPNLALIRPVVASSIQNVSYPASSAVDASTTSRWSSALGVAPQWIYVDLGSVFNISEVKLVWETAYAKAYQIQVSNDAVNWTTIYSTTTGTGGANDLTGLSGSGRYVRMYGTQRGTGWGYSLYEFEVYGAAI